MSNCGLLNVLTWFLSTKSCRGETTVRFGDFTNALPWSSSQRKWWLTFPPKGRRGKKKRKNWMNLAIQIVNEVEKQMRSEKKEKFQQFCPKQLDEWWCFSTWKYLGKTGLSIICDWCVYFTSKWRSLAGVGYKLNTSH